MSQCRRAEGRRASPIFRGRSGCNPVFSGQAVTNYATLQHLTSPKNRGSGSLFRRVYFCVSKNVIASRGRPKLVFKSGVMDMSSPCLLRAKGHSLYYVPLCNKTRKNDPGSTPLYSLFAPTVRATPSDNNAETQESQIPK